MGVGDVRGLVSNTPRTVTLCVLSVAGHLNMVIAAWFIAHALGFGISLADCVVLIPVIVLATTQPISVGDWGQGKARRSVCSDLWDYPIRMHSHRRCN